MLSAGAGKAEFRNILNHAYRAGASGYLAGRAIWLEPFGLYPDWDGMRKGLETGSVDYMRDLNALTDKAATAWDQHAVFGSDGAQFSPADQSFRHSYGNFG